MNLKKDFGLRIKQLRNKRGITQSQLAEIAGIDPKHMSHIETGRSFPKADLIEKFAAAFDVEYKELFNSEYLFDRNVIMEKINNCLKNASDEQIKTLYKIITGYLN